MSTIKCFFIGGIFMNIDWIDFYKEFSLRLLEYKENREELLEKFKIIFSRINQRYPFVERGDTDNYEDICPFTIYATFNKAIKDENRIQLLQQIKEMFHIEAAVPTGFDSIPVMMNLSAWFFAYKEKRNETDIDNLWELFEKAIKFADEVNQENRDSFVEIYDKVITQKMVKWNITMGLYWIRPFNFLNLDSKNREYLLNHPLYKKIVLSYSILRTPPSGENYVSLIENLKLVFTHEESEHKNFIELSHEAYNFSLETVSPPTNKNKDTRIEGTNYWIISLGLNSANFDEYYTEGIVAIGWEEMGDLNQYSTRKKIAEKFRKINSDNKSHKNDSLALWQFFEEIQVGDIVYVKRGLNKVIGRGIIMSAYFYAEKSDQPNRRKINWTHKGEWDHPGKAVQKTLTNITQYTEYVNQLESLFDIQDDELIIKEEPNQYETYTEEEFLNEVFMSPEQYEVIMSALDLKRNVILQGPPGVGKTFSAKRLAHSYLKEKDPLRVKMIQFHQSYSYEDFIMGYRPVKEGFELKPGPFYDFCIQAKDDLDRDYFFIIDEINRGNLSKIFGELLMLIEKDKRGQYLKLMYKEELFTVPENVYLIGLMNTADRSLAMIDYALRRRFAFIEMEPAFDNSIFRKKLEYINNPVFFRLIQQIKSLNKEIEDDENLGKGFLIGHSYFCVFDEFSVQRLKSIIKHEIIPLLKEYWYDEKEKVNNWEDRLLGVING